MFNFIVGLIFGVFILEPLVINYIYFSNIDLFIDIILTRKNEHKLVNCVLNRTKKED